MCYDFKEEAKEFVKTHKNNHSYIIYGLYVFCAIFDIGCMSYFAITHNTNDKYIVPALVIINVALFTIVSIIAGYFVIIIIINKQSFNMINGLINIINDANVPTDFTSDEYFNLINEHIKKIEQDIDSKMRRYYNKKLKKD